MTYNISFMSLDSKQDTHIVLEVVYSLDLGVTGLVVNVQVAEQTDSSIGLHQTTARVRHEALSDDGVLDGDLGDSSVDGKGFVTAPRGTDVIKDHVLAVGDGDGVLSRGSSSTHADGDVSHDGIVGVGKGPAIAVHHDSLSTL